MKALIAILTLLMMGASVKSEPEAPKKPIELHLVKQVTAIGAVISEKDLPEARAMAGKILPVITG